MNISIGIIPTNQSESNSHLSFINSWASDRKLMINSFLSPYMNQSAWELVQFWFGSKVRALNYLLHPMMSNSDIDNYLWLELSSPKGIFRHFYLSNSWFLPFLPHDQGNLIKRWFHQTELILMVWCHTYGPRKFKNSECKFIIILEISSLL